MATSLTEMRNERIVIRSSLSTKESFRILSAHFVSHEESLLFLMEVVRKYGGPGEEGIRKLKAEIGVKKGIPGRIT